MGADDLRDLPDEVLVKRFKATREEASFSEIFRRYKKSVYQRCLAVLRSPPAAEDVTQETFVRLFEGVEGLRGSNLGAWLHRVAWNLSMDHLARQLRSEAGKREAQSSLTEVLGALQTDHRLVDQVRAIIEQLPSHQRIPMKLFYLAGYSYKEIARYLGYTEAEVKSYLQNGKRQFRIKWEELKSSPRVSE